jgi:CheY-like chemotaxis protein
MAKILVVDDDEQVRDVFKRTLEAHGHEVREAGDGRSAMRSYREQPADLVILDIIMPEQDGLETILDLRRDFPEAKIIAISGGGRASAQGYLRPAKILGADRAYSKPLAPNELLAAIEQLLKEGDR